MLIKIIQYSLARVANEAREPVARMGDRMAKPKRDRVRLARNYQAFLDSGEPAPRAELARILGVSRARVMQVLRGLESSR